MLKAKNHYTCICIVNLYLDEFSLSHSYIFLLIPSSGECYYTQVNVLGLVKKLHRIDKIKYNYTILPKGILIQILKLYSSLWRYVHIYEYSMSDNVRRPNVHAFLLRNGQFTRTFQMRCNLLPFVTSLRPFLRIKFSPSSRRQRMRGAGWPAAWHTSVALSPSCTVMSELVSSSVISGGTETYAHFLISRLKGSRC